MTWLSLDAWRKLSKSSSKLFWILFLHEETWGALFWWTDLRNSAACDYSLFLKILVLWNTFFSFIYSFICWVSISKSLEIEFCWALLWFGIESWCENSPESYSYLFIIRCDSIRSSFLSMVWMRFSKAIIKSGFLPPLNNLKLKLMII